jgi:hypothetical protein
MRFVERAAGGLRRQRYDVRRALEQRERGGRGNVDIGEHERRGRVER